MIVGGGEKTKGEKEKYGENEKGDGGSKRRGGVLVHTVTGNSDSSTRWLRRQMKGLSFFLFCLSLFPSLLAILNIFWCLLFFFWPQIHMSYEPMTKDVFPEQLTSSKFVFLILSHLPFVEFFRFKPSCLIASHSCAISKEINQRHGLIQGGEIVVDLGAAPGSWSQYIVELLSPSSSPLRLRVYSISLCSTLSFTNFSLTEQAQERQEKHQRVRDCSWFKGETRGSTPSFSLLIQLIHCF